MSLCFNLQMAGSLLSFFSCGCSIRNMYDGWTPENFINRVEKNKGNLNAEKRCACALMASLSLYPERSETLDTYASRKRSAAVDLLIPLINKNAPGMRENFLSIMSEGRAGTLSLSKKNIPVLAGMLLEAMDTNPGLAAEFIKKQAGKKIETWVKDGVEGADVLVSRLAHRMRQEEFVSEGAGMPDLDLF